MSIPLPNYTQLPNIIIDEWLDKLTGLQLKILLVICRKTIGWHKLVDKISLTQLVNITKSARDKICDAVRALVAFGLIIKEVTGPKGLEETRYELNFQNKYTNSEAPPVEGSKKLLTKETITKERKEILSKESIKKKTIPSDFSISEDDKQELYKQYPKSGVDEMVEAMKDYTKSTGKRYKDYKAAIRTWIRREISTYKFKGKDWIKEKQKEQDGEKYQKYAF